MKLSNKIFIVTGSGTGIGKAIAKLCVKEGAQVVINDKNAALANLTVEELGSENAVPHIRDLTEDGCPEELVALAKERFGKLDGLVNNAAFVTWSNLDSTDRDYFRKVLEVNTIAPSCPNPSGSSRVEGKWGQRGKYWQCECPLRGTHTARLLRFQRGADHAHP